jgi:hypothetical protein
MEQERMMMNGEDVHQPDENLKYGFETKYSEDSGRVQSGDAHLTPLFTVEQLGYSATNIPQAEATKIVRMICTGRPFTLHYFSLYYGTWRDDKFYVGKGEYTIGSLKKGEEYVESLSFNMTGKSPLREVK